MARRRRTSIYTEVALELQAELRRAREQAEPPPARFMHHDVKPSEMLRQAEHMTPAQRAELPRDAVLKAIRASRGQP
jgi:hypothetical protein